MPSRAHVEPLCDPRQRHRRPRTQLPGQLDLLRLSLPPRSQVGLAPAHPFRPLHHPPLGLLLPPPPPPAPPPQNGSVPAACPAAPIAPAEIPPHPDTSPVPPA